MRVEMKTHLFSAILLIMLLQVSSLGRYNGECPQDFNCDLIDSYKLISSNYASYSDYVLFHTDMEQLDFSNLGTPNAKNVTFNDGSTVTVPYWKSINKSSCLDYCRGALKILQLTTTNYTDINCDNSREDFKKILGFDSEYNCYLKVSDPNRENRKIASKKFLGFDAKGQGARYLLNFNNCSYSGSIVLCFDTLLSKYNYLFEHPKYCQWFCGIQNSNCMEFTLTKPEERTPATYYVC